MIQWSRIDELLGEIGKDDFEEIVQLFLEEVQEVIGRLQIESSHDQLEQDLHFLKGSALNLGFLTFSDLCQKGELLASKGQANQVNLEEILEGYEKSRTVFIAELPQRIAA